MDVFVDTIDSPSFSIEVGLWDTVLTIKQKIEISQGVPVSKQTLFFQKKILQDHLYTIQCHILQNSRLLLSISPEDIPNHNNNHQTKLSPAPSNSTQQRIHWPEKRRSNNTQELQTKQSTAPSNSTQQSIHWPEKRRSNNTQVLQTKQSTAATNQLDEFVNSQGWPLMVESNNEQVLLTEKIEVSENTIEEFLDIQDSSVMVTEQPPVASDSVGEAIYGQDSSVMVRSSNYNELRSFSETQYHLSPVTRRNTNQVVRPLASEEVTEIINIPDSPVKKKIKIGPMKIIVMVMPFKETWSIPVEVNADDNVEELRNELVKMQERGQINLPQEGYIFIHKQRPLDEDHSFRWNLVGDGDTIDIFRAYFV